MSLNNEHTPYGPYITRFVGFVFNLVTILYLFEFFEEYLLPYFACYDIGVY